MTAKRPGVLATAGTIIIAAWLVSGRAPAADGSDPLPAGAVLRLGSARLRHGGTVNAVVFSPDGKALASAGADRLVRVWAVPGGRELHRLAGHTGEVRAVAFSPDGAVLA